MSHSDSEFLDDNKSKSTLFSVDWFSEVCVQWFLSQNDKDPIINGEGGWFSSLVDIAENTAKVIFRKKIGFEDVKIVIARTNKTKQQYYKLRERLYRKKLGFKDYDGHETSYDQAGNIIVGIYKGEVIAGARLDFSSKHKDLMYNDNFELNGFTYKDLAKRLDSKFTEGDVFTEICAAAVYEKVKPDFYEKLVATIITHAKNMGASYVFGIVYPHSFDVYGNALQRLRLELKIFHDLRFNIKGSYGKNNGDLEFFPLGTVLKGSDL